MNANDLYETAEYILSKRAQAEERNDRRLKLEADIELFETCLNLSREKLAALESEQASE